jgi:selenocysteine-specific elongation factor
VNRHLVVGTAGHIDHGKTALVKALTGVDTDRFAEEKRRGITIDLGFAPLTLGAGDEETAASVVDVPGHEGFIKNMVAGATGVDLALLVVAADEGVMPQTTEHLAILRFLGVARGVVALTKCDLAPDPAWRALVADEVRERVAAAFGRAWPVVEVSAVAGTGLEALRAALAEESRALVARPAADRFRLPVDRAFALAGAGTVVTGTLWSGTARDGDTVTVLPAGLSARIRSIEVHDRPAAEAVPGRRTALALVGPSHADVPRGSVVVTGGGWRAARAMDVVLTMLPEAAKPRPRLRVRVNHGTSEVLARLSLPPAPPDAAAAGAAGIPARLMLEEPVVARGGDRFVVRSYSPVTTIGGGVVLDPWADDPAVDRKRGLRSLADAWRDALSGNAARVTWLVRRRGARGLERRALEVAAGLDAGRLDAALREALTGALLERDGWLVAAREETRVAETLARALERHHAQHPLEPGMPAQAWRAAAGRVPAALVDLAERQLSQDGQVERAGSVVRRAGWAPKLGAATERLRGELLAALREADAEPPSLSELVAQHPGGDVGGLLRLMAREGVVVPVGKDRFYEAAALRAERERVVAVLRELGEATPAMLRDRLGRSRKWLIPLLEWCDAQGITVRQGDRRVLGSGAGA